jgi:hypothetical protein
LTLYFYGIFKYILHVLTLPVIYVSIEEDIASKVTKIKELKQEIESLEKQVQPTTRKLQSTAMGTYFVSLPKGWCEKHGLKKGSLITISEQKNSLIILP